MKLGTLELGLSRANKLARRGFALVEVVTGMMILGVVLVALYAALASAFSTVNMERDNLRATQILVEKMEIVRMYHWEQFKNPTLWPKFFTAYSDPAGVTNATGRGALFSGRITVAPGPTDVLYGDDMRAVTIDITWKTGNMQRSRQFQSYITKNGLQNYSY
jgi:prepilin-type N-terminal cleavage/methylation domain-containing protein